MCRRAPRIVRALSAVALIAACSGGADSEEAPASASDPPRSTGARGSAGPRATDATDATDSRDEPRATEDVCDLPAPVPEGKIVTILKGPYLQWPTSHSMTVAFETVQEVDGRVVVWADAGDGCPVAVVPTTPTILDISKDPFPLEQAPGLQHAAEIVGLEPGTRYTYQVVIRGTASDVAGFRTAPGPGQDYRVAILGDNRTHDDQHQAVVDAIVLHAPDVVFNTGDAMDTGGVIDDWEGFFAIEGPLLREAPLLPVYGNHEAIFGETYYRGYWTLRDSYAGEELNYALAYGNSYWVVYDTVDQSGEALPWLEEQLAGAADYPYLFVTFHHPLYSFSKHTPNQEQREALHPLFLKYGVSAVFNGHNHCYERFVVDGLDYVVTGGGGAPLYDIDLHPVPDLEDARVAARSAHHFVIGDVTALEASFTVHDVDSGEVIETFAVQPRP